MAADDADDACECDAMPLATNLGDYFRKKRLHEKCVKRREATRPQTKGPCRNCHRTTNWHLIDTSQPHNSPERAQRFCFGCRPEAVENAVWVIDRTGEFPLDERIRNLKGNHGRQ